PRRRDTSPRQPGRWPVDRRRASGPDGRHADHADRRHAGDTGDAAGPDRPEADRRLEGLEEGGGTAPRGGGAVRGGRARGRLGGGGAGLPSMPLQPSGDAEAASRPAGAAPGTGGLGKGIPGLGGMGGGGPMGGMAPMGGQGDKGAGKGKRTQGEEE